MASNRMMRREEKRIRLQEKHQAKRAELRKSLKNPELSLEEKFEIQAQLQKLPRDSSKVRQSNRCGLTGRAHGVYRVAGLCRNKIRQLVMEGLLPGFVKSSW